MMAANYDSDDGEDDENWAEGRPRRRKKLCLACSVLVVVVCASIAVAYALAPQSDATDENSVMGSDGAGPGMSVSGDRAGASVVSGTANPSGTAPFHAVDANHLNQTCSRDEVETYEGYNICKDLCETAGCCFYEKWDPLSCLKLHMHLCDPYIKACSVLNEFPFSQVQSVSVSNEMVALPRSAEDKPELEEQREQDDGSEGIWQ
uniref:Uncharacterized protein n=1 Tax=Pseudictyota dubia TaxID=2749911 RepID=A0A7R9WDE3_9STRA